MTDGPLWDQVVSVIRQTFDDEALEVTRETTADDVPDWDSLSNIELMVALELTFRIKFSTGEIAGFKNVGELMDVIETRTRDAGK